MKTKRQMKERADTLLIRLQNIPNSPDNHILIGKIISEIHDIMGILTEPGDIDTYSDDNSGDLC